MCPYESIICPYVDINKTNFRLTWSSLMNVFFAYGNFFCDGGRCGANHHWTSVTSRAETDTITTETSMSNASDIGAQQLAKGVTYIPDFMASFKMDHHQAFEALDQQQTLDRSADFMLT
jgi:hypothetical protein